MSKTTDIIETADRIHKRWIEQSVSKPTSPVCTCGHAKPRHFFGFEEHCKEIGCKCERFDSLHAKPPLQEPEKACTCCCHRFEKRILIAGDFDKYPSKCIHGQPEILHPDSWEEGFDKVWKESMFSSRGDIALEGKGVKDFIRTLLALHNKQLRERIYQWAKEYNQFSDLVATSSLMRFLDKLGGTK